MPTLGERLRDKWVSAAIPVRPGAGPDEIRAFESRYDIVLPRDLREYLLIVDGMERWQSDSEMLEFLHLGAIKTVVEEVARWPDWRNIINTLPQPDRYFVIVDFMLSSNVFAIRLSDDASLETPLFCIIGDHYWKSAESFTEFGEKYLEGGVMALKWDRMKRKG